MGDAGDLNLPRLLCQKRKSLSLVVLLSLNGMSCVKEATAFRKIRASCGRSAQVLQGSWESRRFCSERTDRLWAKYSTVTPSLIARFIIPMAPCRTQKIWDDEAISASSSDSGRARPEMEWNGRNGDASAT